MNSKLNSGLNSVYLGKRKKDYEELKENRSKRMENMVQKLSKLNKEFKIKMKKNNEKNISPQVKVIGESLNDFTNQLLNFYKKSYFHIKNKEKRAKFLSDLKLIISIYGKFEDIFQNTYISNNILGNTKREGSKKEDKKEVKKEGKKEVKSEEVIKIEKSFIESINSQLKKKPIKPIYIEVRSLPKKTEQSSQEAEGPQGTKGEEGEQLSQGAEGAQLSEKPRQNISNNIEVNLLNNSNNCYRNSVLHLLVSILRNEFNTNLNNAFDVRYDICNTKENLKNLLISLVLKRAFHPQAILITYNSFLTEVSSERSSNRGNYFLIRNNRFTISRNNNQFIRNLNELCLYYPNLDIINSAYNFYNQFKINLEENIKINSLKNSNQKRIIKMIVDNVFTSYASSDIYLSQLLNNSNVFSNNFLNRIQINNTFILYPYFDVNRNMDIKIQKYNIFNEYLQQVIRNYDIINDIQNNRYLITSSIYLLTFNNYNFDNIYEISKNYYQITDIIYTSEGHYVSLNMRNGDWYLYDDTSGINVPENLGHRPNLFNLESRGFYPNIFLLKKIEMVNN